MYILNNVIFLMMYILVNLNTNTKMQKHKYQDLKLLPIGVIGGIPTIWFTKLAFMSFYAAFMSEDLFCDRNITTIIST